MPRFYSKISFMRNNRQIYHFYLISTRLTRIRKSNFSIVFQKNFIYFKSDRIFDESSLSDNEIRPITEWNLTYSILTLWLPEKCPQLCIFRMKEKNCLGVCPNLLVPTDFKIKFLFTVLVNKRKANITVLIMKFNYSCRIVYFNAVLK